MTVPVLIYCAGGNKRFYEIATVAGFEYGARLPDTVYGRLYFADQDFHDPNRETYMAALARHRPVMASVLDLEREEQLDDVLDWAEEAAQYIEHVMLIPKAPGIINKLPRHINGAGVILGYSVPTQYGGTDVPIWEFAGWPIHLLGGSPHKQMELWRYFTVIAQVVSVDGNYINKMATRYCQFWTPGDAQYANNRWWPMLKEADGKLWGDGSKKTDAPYEAFRRSCENIMKAWKIMCQ